MGDSGGPSGPDLKYGVELTEIPVDGVLEGQLDGESLLLSRDGDQVFAVGGACTHYGGPLVEGLVEGGRVHCPWHHACFDLRTGEALAAPAFSPLPTWHVQVKEGRASIGERVSAPKAVAPKGAASDRMVIIGGGAAGFAAADQLRRQGFSGRVTLLSADSAAPYDRPNLSKDYLAGTAQPEWMPLKDEAWYAENEIDLRLKTTARGIDVGERLISTSGGDLAYDRLLLATGAQPIMLATPGFDRPEVRVLRSMADADAIIALAKDARRAVVIGAGFVGLEAAAALTARGVEVAVVAREALPMQGVLGAELAKLVVDRHRANGVSFHLERQATKFDGAEVVLDDGSRIATDLVLVGVGVRPRVELAQAAGLAIDNGVVVDALFRTSTPDIFAVGDVARYPDPISGELARVEHWVAAQRQGQVAAANMLGAMAPFEEAPFFWSNHYDLAIHFVGQATGWDRREVDGDLAALDATVRYYRAGRMVAAATIGRDRESLVLAQGLSGDGSCGTSHGSI